LRLRVRARQGSNDESSLTWARTHQALPLEIPVCLEHRVGINSQFDDDLLGRRELITWFEETKLKGLVNLVDQLEIRGDAGRRVELKLNHPCLFSLITNSTNVIVKTYINRCANVKLTAQG